MSIIVLFWITYIPFTLIMLPKYVSIVWIICFLNIFIHLESQQIFIELFNDAYGCNSNILNGTIMIPKVPPFLS